MTNIRWGFLERTDVSEIFCTFLVNDWWIRASSQSRRNEGSYLHEAEVESIQDTYVLPKSFGFYLIGPSAETKAADWPKRQSTGSEVRESYYMTRS